VKLYSQSVVLPMIPIWRTHYTHDNDHLNDKLTNQGSEKPVFKMHDPLGFWVLLGFRILYFNKQLGSLLVDLAHQLRLYSDSPVF